MPVMDAFLQPVKDKGGASFCTGMGMRQGCVRGMDPSKRGWECVRDVSGAWILLCGMGMRQEHGSFCAG